MLLSTHTESDRLKVSFKVNSMYESFSMHALCAPIDVANISSWKIHLLELELFLPGAVSEILMDLNRL